MMTNGKIATALVGGYLLGRTKKAKVAVGLGMFLAGRKLSLDPRQLGQLVADSPLLGGVTDQLRSELIGATKSAAGSALTRRMNRLSDSLSDKAQGLDARTTDDVDESASESHDDAADEEAHSGVGERYEREEEKPRTPSRPTAPKADAKAPSVGGTAKRRAVPAARSSAEGSRPSRPQSRGAATKGQRRTGSTGSNDGVARASRSARTYQEDKDRG
ncbi:hypothetical protein [Streptomyces sp. NPDC006289]|uniref:hypothetical protein n=1 Tax=Streptomyces sp. NPDC006289 TaxID=3156744 RepID=UPI0033A361DF